MGNAEYVLNYETRIKLFQWGTYSFALACRVPALAAMIVCSKSLQADKFCLISLTGAACF